MPRKHDPETNPTCMVIQAPPVLWKAVQDIKAKHSGLTQHVIHKSLLALALGVLEGDPSALGPYLGKF